MVESADAIRMFRNLVVYLVGIGLAVGGALGLADAVELSIALAGGLFIVGLAVVVFVHERLDGPF